MGLDVDVPDAFPIFIGNFQAALHHDAGVGAEQVDDAIGFHATRHQPLHMRFVRDVSGDCDPADFARNSFGRAQIDIGDHDPSGALRGEPAAESSPNPVRPARDDDYLVSNQHSEVF